MESIIYIVYVITSTELHIWAPVCSFESGFAIAYWDFKKVVSNFYTIGLWMLNTEIVRGNHLHVRDREHSCKGIPRKI